MQITVERESFNSALSSVKRVIEKRNAIPILGNVMLSAENGVLSLFASDSEMESIVSIACETACAGRLTLPAHALADMVKAAPKGALVALEQVPGLPGVRAIGVTSKGKTTFEPCETPRVKVSTGRASATLTGIVADDMPRLGRLASGEMKAGAFDWMVSFKASAPAFKRLLEACQFAVSTEETRYYLNGVFLHVVKGALVAVATDGHRLAKTSMDSPDMCGEMPGVIIPRACVAELIKLLGKQGGAVHVAVNRAFVEFRIGGAVLLSKTIDGTFHDYARVVPSKNDRLVTVNRAAFSEAVKRISVLVKTRGAACKLTFEGNYLNVSVDNPEIGQISEKIDAIWHSGPPLEIGFNARYLLDIAGVINGGDMLFRMGDSGTPAIITDPANGAEAFVLMPLRV